MIFYDPMRVALTRIRGLVRGRNGGDFTDGDVQRGFTMEENNIEAESHEIWDERAASVNTYGTPIGYERPSVNIYGEPIYEDSNVPDSNRASTPEEQMVSMENIQPESDVFDRQVGDDFSKIEIGRVENDPDTNGLAEVEKAIRDIVGSDLSVEAVDDELRDIWERAIVRDSVTTEATNFDEVTEPDGIIYGEIVGLYDQQRDSEVDNPYFLDLEGKVEDSDDGMGLDGTNSGPGLESIIESDDAEEWHAGLDDNLLGVNSFEDEVGDGWGELINSDFEPEVEVEDEEEEDDLLFVEPLAFLEY